MCFKVQGSWVKKLRKVYIRLHTELENIEDLIMDHLIATGGTEVYGSAPRGSLERRISDLMKDLGITREELM